MRHSLSECDFSNVCQLSELISGHFIISHVVYILLKVDQLHRRIQDFVRGGGGKALLPPPPGSAPDYLGEQYFVGRGGPRPPWPPRLDPRLNSHDILLLSISITEDATPFHKDLKKCEDWLMTFC